MEQTQAHHILESGLRGMALKSPDRYSIPLDWKIHNELHRFGSETRFLSLHGVINVMDIADHLYECYLNNAYDEAYDSIIKRFL